MKSELIEQRVDRGVLEDVAREIGQRNGRELHIQGDSLFCPLHDDEKGGKRSATIRKTSNRYKFHCFVCDIDEDAAGLAERGGLLKRASDLPRGYRTLETACARIAKRLNAKVVEKYHYADDFFVVRFEPKDFRPVWKRNGRWVERAPKPRPLFNAAKITRGCELWLLEGEKDVLCAEKLLRDAAQADREIAERCRNIVCITSSGGPGGVRATNWTPCAGHSVVAFPHHDGAGFEYPRVAASQMPEDIKIRVVELPGAPEKGGDFFDFGQLYDDQGAEVVVRELFDLIQEAPEITSGAVELRIAASPGSNDIESADRGHDQTTKFHLTDVGNAERFVHQHQDVLRYTDAHGWMHWDGCRWQRDRLDAVQQLAIATIRGMYAVASRIEDSDKRKSMIDWARRCEHRSRVENMLVLARSMPPIRVRAEDFDTDKMKLTVLNGTLDLRTCELHHHDPEDQITKLAPVTYDRAAAAPAWDRFLEQVMGGDVDLISFLQRLAGYSLTGDTMERIFIVLYGSGRNGRSTFLNAIKGVMGDYATTANPQAFVAKRNDSIPCDVARLAGARLVAMVETEENRRLDTAMVKQATGGTDVLVARFRRQEFFEFKPEFTPWLGTNHRPTVRDDSDAIWDRIILIPFEVRISEDQVDLRLPEKLQEELPGILNWMLAGLRDWAVHGLMIPKKVVAATQQYRTEQDILGQWIDERTIEDADSEVRAGDICRNYEEWCGENGYRPVTNQWFGRRLAERFRKVKRSGSNFYLGVRLC